MATTWSVSALPTSVFGRIGHRFGPIVGGSYTQVATVDGRREVRCLITSSSGGYTTGGDAIPASKFGLSRVDAVYVVADEVLNSIVGGANFPQFDLSNPAIPKLKLYSGANTERPATGISGYTFGLVVVGV